jgi:hypothetical protein
MIFRCVGYDSLGIDKDICVVSTEKLIVTNRKHIGSYTSNRTHHTDEK